LVAKPSHMELDMDGLACSLHHHMVYSHQRGGQNFLACAALSCHAAVGGVVFPRDVKPPGMDILYSVDRLVTCKIESYMEKLAFTEACLSDVGVIMVIMCVPLVESLCQVAMR
jgi:hypothetical protein